MYEEGWQSYIWSEQISKLIFCKHIDIVSGSIVPGSEVKFSLEKSSHKDIEQLKAVNVESDANRIFLEPIPTYFFSDIDSEKKEFLCSQRIPFVLGKFPGTPGSFSSLSEFFKESNFLIEDIVTLFKQIKK